VEVPKQRNTREENERIQESEDAESFEAKPQVKAQKDDDVRGRRLCGFRLYSPRGGVTRAGRRAEALRERRPEPTADRRAKSEQPGEVQDTVPGRAHLRSDEIAGAGRNHAMHREGEGELSDRDAESGL
jgi:hypothetical protein